MVASWNNLKAKRWRIQGRFFSIFCHTLLDPNGLLIVNTLYFLTSPSTHPNFTLWGVLRWKWEHTSSPRRSAVWEKKVLDLENIFYASRTLPAKLSVLLPLLHIPDYCPLQKQYLESWTISKNAPCLCSRSEAGHCLGWSQCRQSLSHVLQSHEPECSH